VKLARRILTATLAGLLGFTLTAAPAEASSGMVPISARQQTALVYGCSADHTFCLYDNTWSFPFAEWDGWDFPVGTCLRNIQQVTSYIKSTMNRRVYVYQTTNCSGYSGTIYPNSEGAMTGVWNNSIQSAFASSLTY
jgi:hypothetical protein